jgi:hypothetical protein
VLSARPNVVLSSSAVSHNEGETSNCRDDPLHLSLSGGRICEEPVGTGHASLNEEGDEVHSQ